MVLDEPKVSWECVRGSNDKAIVVGVHSTKPQKQLYITGLLNTPVLHKIPLQPGDILVRVNGVSRDPNIDDSIRLRCGSKCVCAQVQGGINQPSVAGGINQPTVAGKQLEYTLNSTPTYYDTFEPRPSRNADCLFFQEYEGEN